MNDSFCKFQKLLGNKKTDNDIKRKTAFEFGGFFICSSGDTETKNGYCQSMVDDSKDDLKPTSSDSVSDCEEKQSARCLLREKFLRAVTGIIGKECTLHMHYNTNVRGIFRGNDIEFETLLMERLSTPLVELPSAKIRSIDVNFIEFKDFSNS